MNLLTFILPDATTSTRAKGKLIYKITKPLKTKIISNFPKMPRKLKTQNANRNSIEVKVTLKPEQCKLMDSAIQILFGDEMSRSQFLKICLNDKLRKVTLGDA